MVRWRSKPVEDYELPGALNWVEEPPSTYHTVKLAFAAYYDGSSYRRLTFPDGQHMYSHLEYERAR